MGDIHPAAQEFIDDLMDSKNQIKQGRGALQPGTNGFCCLGMLCRAAERHGVKVYRHPDGRISGGLLASQPAVKQWAKEIGLEPDSTGSVLLGYNATVANDETRLSFAEIGQELADRLAP